MSQIKPGRIIPRRSLKQNQGSALPVDLNPVQRDLILEAVTTATSPTTDEVATDSILSEESVLRSADQTPSTPAIIGVKSYVIKFQLDGTAKIDLVLEVQDIEGAVEYDIRVAKDSGNV